MKELLFQNILPFVRYSHLLDNNIQDSINDVYAYDNRLFYCIKGSGTVTIDHIVYPVHAGMLLIWKAGVPYRYATDKASPMQLLAINFDFTNSHAHLSIPIPPDHTNTYTENRQLEKLLFTDALLFNEPVILHSQHHLSEKLMEINKEYQEQKIYFQQRCSGILLQILGQIARDGDSQNVHANNVIDAIISYMNENYESEITNQKMGTLFGYHPNYLNQLFTKYTGKSMYHYLQNIRIMHAISLLQNTDLPIYTIATKVGFHDFPHFSRYFKEQTGHTPTAFRSQ